MFKRPRILAPQIRKTVLLLSLAATVLFTDAVLAQNQSALYASVLKTPRYAVGSQLTASGLYRLHGDSSWQHLGWNNPRVYDIAFDPKDSNIIYLACGNGVLRTLDGGRSWRVTTDWRVTEVLGVCVDSNSSQEVYAATAYGVWRSPNRGDDWIESNDGFRRKYTQAIVVDRQRARRVFAGTESGLYVSTNGARNWRAVEASEDMILAVEQSRSAPRVWLAGTQSSGVLVSNDGGESWGQPAGEIRNASIYEVTIDATNAKRMAAVGWQSGVYVSDDGGQSWPRRGASLPTQNFYDVIFNGGLAGQIWAATVEEGIFVSDDQGLSWQYRGLRGALIFDLAVAEIRE